MDQYFFVEYVRSELIKHLHKKRNVRRKNKWIYDDVRWNIRRAQGAVPDGGVDWKSRRLVLLILVFFALLSLDNIILYMILYNYQLEGINF